AEKPRGIRDRLSMISRRRRDHAARLFLWRQPRDQVDSAADLEGADRMMIFMLHEDVEAELCGQPRVVMKGRRMQITVDDALGVEYVGKFRRSHSYILRGISIPIRSSVRISVCRVNSITAR